MLKQKTIAFYRIVEKFTKAYFSLIFCFVVLAIAGIMTFTLQNNVVGFEPGYDVLAPKHHGSVSSKTLAIISNATLENHFVGYAVRYKDDQGKLIYEYFDRYPVFFSAIFNRILALRTKLSSKIYLARQVMNLIFVATLIVAFLLIDKLIKNKPLSLAAIFFAFSNPYLLFYKDMVHFDQPALFGMVLLTYAIALYKIDSLKWPMYVATIVAIALGRGYASYAILFPWLLIEAFLIFRSRNTGFGQKVKNVLKHPSFSLVVIGVIWGASLLSYNIVMEAQKRNVSILGTSIVDSAERRLALSENFNEQYEGIINWTSYTLNEITRIIKWTSPVKWPGPEYLVSIGLLAAMFVIIGLAMRRQPLENRVIWLILAVSGFAWLIPMRNLAAFHDYTTMYFLGISLVFFMSVLVLLKPSRDAKYYLALLGFSVYLSGIIQVGYWHTTIASNVSEYTYDFMRIEDALGGAGKNVFMKDSVPYGTNAVDFYLQDQYLAPLSLADYVVSVNKYYAPDNLTPDNQYFYLFKKPR